ncbi:MAG: DUF4349 domain-containing protein [Clostridia bacterium]|nr:DUF4349 domain-containing protein [Clostridia bacterium]
MRSYLKGILSVIFTFIVLISAISCSKSSDSEFSDSLSPESTPPIVNGEVNRNIVYNVNVSLVSDNVSKTKENIDKKSKSLKGYVESNDEEFSDGKCTYIYAVYRIPTENLDAFLKSVEGSGSIERKNVSTMDITTEYVNAKAQKKALDDRKAMLEDILNDSGISASDRITTINEIASVNTELQYIELMINGYDSDLNYSTVTIRIREPYAPIGIIINLIFVIILLTAVTILIIKRKKSKKKSAQ